MKNFFPTFIEHKFNNFKNNIKDKVIWILVLIVIALNAVVYTKIFTLYSEKWTLVMSADLTFIVIDTIVCLCFIKKNTARAILWFFITVKLLTIFASILAHDISALANNSSLREYLFVVSLLSTFSGLAVALLFILFIFVSSIFFTFEYLIYSKEGRGTTAKWILAFIVIWIEISIYSVAYKFIIYNQFLTETKKLLNDISTSNKNINIKALQRIYEDFKPILVFLSVPLLMNINVLNRGNVFISKGKFMTISTQFTVLSELIEINEAFNSEFILPTVITAVLILNNIYFAYIVIRTITYNAKIKENPPYPILYKWTKIENNIYKRLYERKVKKIRTS